MFDMLRQAGIFALLSLAVTVIPLVVGVIYALRPTEAKLALMRPVSLAGLFAALSGFVAGLLNVLRYVVVKDVPLTSQVPLLGLAESLVSLFVGFGCLTVAWLCVALGLRRQA